MRIQHNIMAMSAYRNYNTNTSAVAKNLEKLSSGYKINRAGDDAAGLAISEKMRAQITGLNAAQKNVKDGISLVKTAEGAMQEIQDMLNRMDYLATQSANGTYDSSVDRTNLQKEVNALRDEINRIADSANFNGIKLLDGSQQGVKAQSAWTETIEGKSYTGMDRIVSAEVPSDDKPLENNGVQTVFDAYAQSAAAGSFTVGFDKLKFNFKALGTAAGSFGGTNWAMATLTVKIGSLSIEVKASHFASSVKITASKGVVTGSITASNVAQAVFNAIKAKTGASSGATSATITLNKVSCKVTVNGGKLNFQQLSKPQNAEEAKTNFAVTVTAGAAAATAGKKVQVDIAGQMYDGTVTTKEAVPEGAKRLAETIFEIKDEDIVDQAKITLGSKTFTIKLGGDSKVTETNNVIDLSNYKLGDAGLVDLALSKISKAIGTAGVTFTNEAGQTATFKVTVMDDSNGGKHGLAVIRASYATSATDKSMFKTLEDLAKNFSLSYPTQTVDHKAVVAQGGLTLQIGDTSDDFNQMKVNIGDMHVDKMGYTLDKRGEITKSGKSIADIDISTQEGAADAIDTIKNAINYVSGVRGDLGAVQNRLEHTQNNLSVMAENIQDAESTIRDTDIAEEMMAYTKNNILVQSAQAMLAQANQVPQGVLQLLG